MTHVHWTNDYAMEDEKIAFIRTMPNLSMIFTDTEWTSVKSEHFIHEFDKMLSGLYHQAC